MQYYMQHIKIDRIQSMDNERLINSEMYSMILILWEHKICRKIYVWSEKKCWMLYSKTFGKTVQSILWCKWWNVHLLHSHPLNQVSIYVSVKTSFFMVNFFLFNILFSNDWYILWFNSSIYHFDRQIYTYILESS